MWQKQQRPLTVFCIAAPEDASLLAQWEEYLLPLQEDGYLTIWSGQHRVDDASHDEGSLERLLEADLLLLLVSPAFFAADECLALMEQALQRHIDGEAGVLLLLLQAVASRELSLASLSCLPSNGIPVDEWDDTDAALRDCVQGIIDLFERPSTSRSLETQDRRAWMLERLSQAYKDSPQDSWQQMAWSRLGLSAESAALVDVSQRLQYFTDQNESPLAPGISILQVFDEARHELLILGEPGSGRSTLLLELARRLLKRAKYDELSPLPVMVNLASWAGKRPPIQVWLSEQISQAYQVPRWLSQRWIKKRQLLLLFDGLDEIDETARSHCIVALNAYCQMYPGMLAVCDHTAAAHPTDSTSQLALQKILIVQPISQEQIETLLTQTGQPLQALQKMFTDCATLRKVMSTPLMLTVCMLAYYEAAPGELPRDETLAQQQVWSHYVQRMSAEREDLARYPLSQTRQWLSWLAKEMHMRRNSTCSLESFQPDWLPRRQRVLYQLSCGLLLGLVGGLLGGGLFGAFGALAGGLGALLLGLLDGRIRPVRAFSWSWRRTRSGLPGGLLIGLTGGLGAVLVYSLIVGSYIGPVIGLLYVMLIILPTALPIGVFAGLSGGLLGSIIYGFAGGQPSGHVVDGGIRRSAVNGLAGALPGGCLGALLGGVLGMLTARPMLVLAGGLVGLATSALVLGLWAVLQYLLLRLWLWRSKCFPWKVRSFLDASVDCLLLQRTAGRYSFIHRLLFEYLANLDQPERVLVANGARALRVSEMPLATEQI